MADYGKKPKKFVFKDFDDTHAKVLLKCKEDIIPAKRLFRMFIYSYINDDPAIRAWIDNHPELKISARCATKRKSEYKKIEKESELFNLEQNEVDEIFDILSEEFED